MMTKHKRIFILNDPTMLRIVPSLAKEIGLNESIILLQIEYWISISNNEREGKRWTFQSIREMQNKAFPFWGKSTIHRAIKSLIEKGYLIEKTFNKYRYDKTCWYALGNGLKDLKSITILGVEQDLSQNGTTMSQDGTRSCQNGTTIPESTTEITTENENTGENHAPSFEQHYRSVMHTINSGFCDLEVEGDIVMADKHLGHLANESKRKSSIREKFKEKEIPALIQNWERGRVIYEKIGKGGVKIKTSPQNSNSIITLYRELFKEHFGGTPPLELEKDRALVKKMIDHYGFDYVKEMFLWTFKNWAVFVREKKIKGLPTVGVIFGFRSYIQSKILSIVETNDESEW